MKKIRTSLNTRLALRALFAPSGIRKTAVGRALSAGTPFERFSSPTFGAGVVALQHPIICPKRQLPKRYAKWWLKNKNLN